MDLLPKTKAVIRTEARSAIYRAALRPGVSCCYGFLIGTIPDFVSPSFELSLPCACVERFDDAFSAPDVFSSHLPACREVAHNAETEPVGIFGAWEPSFEPRANQLLGLFIDTARTLRLPYVALFPTTAGEAMWGVSLYFANRFPHEPITYRMASGRRSVSTAHNPRRVRAQWRSTLHSHQLQ